MQNEIMINTARAYLVIAKALKERNIETWVVYALKGKQILEQVLNDSDKTNILYLAA